MVSKGTVLLIDNNENQNISNRGALERSRYTVYTATAYAQARTMIRDENPDVIVMEAELPDGDGFAFCQEIRNQTAAYIIFLTAITDFDYQSMGFDVGGDMYMTKPFHMPEFVVRVDTAMRRKQKFPLTSSDEIIRRGPLSFDSNGERVFIGSMELILPEDEVYTLWRLVQSMDAYKTFDEIYSTVWDMEYHPLEWDSYEEYARGLTSRESALQQVTHLMETVNAAGKGEVWIEGDTDRGYLFRVRHSRDTGAYGDVDP